MSRVVKHQKLEVRPPSVLLSILTRMPSVLRSMILEFGAHHRERYMLVMEDLVCEVKRKKHTSPE